MTRLEAAGASALRWLDSVGSTNDVALSWAAEGAPHLAVVGAEHQSAGRGREADAEAIRGVGRLQDEAGPGDVARDGRRRGRLRRVIGARACRRQQRPGQAEIRHSYVKRGASHCARRDQYSLNIR